MGDPGGRRRREPRAGVGPLPRQRRGGRREPDRADRHVPAVRERAVGSRGDDPRAAPRPGRRSVGARVAGGSAQPARVVAAGADRARHRDAVRGESPGDAPVHEAAELEHPDRSGGRADPVLRGDGARAGHRTGAMGLPAGGRARLRPLVRERARRPSLVPGDPLRRPGGARGGRRRHRRRRPPGRLLVLPERRPDRLRGARDRPVVGCARADRDGRADVRRRTGQQLRDPFDRHDGRAPARGSRIAGPDDGRRLVPDEACDRAVRARAGRAARSPPSTCRHRSTPPRAARRPTASRRRRSRRAARSSTTATARRPSRTVAALLGDGRRAIGKTTDPATLATITTDPVAGRSVEFDGEGAVALG